MGKNVRVSGRQVTDTGTEQKVREPGVVRWWDRLWGAAWLLGSLWFAYLTARWFAAVAAPANLGALHYGLVAFAALFGLLVGMFLLSAAVIALTTGLEWLFARLGHPLPRPARAGVPPDPRLGATPTGAGAPPGPDPAPAEGK